MFLKKYINENIDKIKIITNYKEKNISEENL